MSRSWIRTLIAYLVLILVVVSLPIFNSGYRNEEKKEEKLQPDLTYVVRLYSDAVAFEKNNDLSYNALSENGEILGNFIMSGDFIATNPGYGGELNVLIGFNNNIINSVILGDNYESRAYVRQVAASGMYDKWKGVELKDIPNMNIDAVSGATYTSSAIIKGVKESVAGYLSVAASYKISVRDIVKIALFTLIVLLSVVMSFGEKMSRFRMIYLLFVIIVSGFIMQNMLSVSLFNGWLKQGVSIGSSWMSVVLLLFALLMPLFGKNRYYCTYLCPMGAMQEVVGKLSPFKKFSLSFLKFRYFSVNDIFLLFVIVAMYSSLNVDLGNIEPFISFAVTIASWGMITFGVCVIILSLFFNRPWCAVCPTGCVLNKLSPPKITNKKM